jgi:hypothetical protein
MATHNNTITDATATNVTNLIAAMETLLAAQGWTKEVTGGAALNAGGTAVESTHFMAQRAMQFTTGADWTFYVWDENCLLVRNAGLTTSTYFLSFGALDRAAAQTAVPVAWRSFDGASCPGYVWGSRNYDGTTLEYGSWWTLGQTNGMRCWNAIAVADQYTASTMTMAWMIQNAAGTAVVFRSWKDGKLFYHKLPCFISNGQYNNACELQQGFIGYMPNWVLVLREDATLMAVGDTMVPTEDATLTYTYGWAGQSVNNLTYFADHFMLLKTGS